MLHQLLVKICKLKLHQLLVKMHTRWVMPKFDNVKYVGQSAASFQTVFSIYNKICLEVVIYQDHYFVKDKKNFKKSINVTTCLIAVSAK